MKIESIAPPEKPGAPWLLLLESGARCKVSDSEMLRFSLHRGQELTDEDLKNLEQAAKTSALRGKASGMLGRKPLSRGELRDKLLAKKDAEPAQVDEIINWAEEIGLLNEADYAKSIVRHYSARGYGLYKLKDELYRRKIPKDLWSEALEQQPDSAAAIDAYLQRHLKDIDQKSQKKAADALARRGFHWSDVAAGLRRFGAEDDGNF